MRQVYETWYDEEEPRIIFIYNKQCVAVRYDHPSGNFMSYIVTPEDSLKVNPVLFDKDYYRLVNASFSYIESLG